MTRRFDHLADVEAFVSVAQRGSISAGAIALGTTPSVLSRALSRLERRLGVQLLRRSTRRLSLTEAGQQYLEQARAAFGLIEEVERSIQQDDSTALGGRVRLSVSTTYGHYRLPAALQRFAAQHPQVQVELSIANRNVDLVAEAFDLAIRLGELPDSGLAARKLEDAALCLVAAPDYLRRAGTPQALDELALHQCLAFVMPSSGRLGSWALRDAAGRDVDWLPGGALQVADDVLGVVSLAEAGAGICQTYDFVARQRLASGRLVEVLPQSRGRSRPFSLIYPPHRSLSAASRALIATLVAVAGEQR